VCKIWADAAPIHLAPNATDTYYFIFFLPGSNPNEHVSHTHTASLHPCLRVGATQGTTTSESGAILLRVVNQDDGSEREERASELYSFLDQGFHSSYQPTKNIRKSATNFIFGVAGCCFCFF
jgi:hypothetical protein